MYTVLVVVKKHDEISKNNYTYCFPAIKKTSVFPSALADIKLIRLIRNIILGSMC